MKGGGVKILADTDGWGLARDISWGGVGDPEQVSNYFFFNRGS